MGCRRFSKKFQALISYSFRRRNKRQNIPGGKAEYALKLFFKPQVSLSQIFFDIQQNVIFLPSGVVGQGKRDVWVFCDSLTGPLSFFSATGGIISYF